MRMSGISYADSLYIPALSISNYDTNGVTIRELGLVGAKLAQNDERVILIVDDGKISATIAEDSTFGRFSGDYMFDFSNIEILYAKVANRASRSVESLGKDIWRLRYQTRIARNYIRSERFRSCTVISPRQL